MDFDSSAKFISSLAKFLQSLCNGYVEFDNGVEVIGHIYLSVDTGKKIDYVLNEKVCKTDENSVTFISNSFHAQPAEKPKPEEKPKPKTPIERDNEEIIVMDDLDQDYSEQQVSSDNVQHNSSQPKPPRPHGASKRSYSQSIASNRPSKISKRDSLSSNPNGAHLSSNNSANDSSFNVAGNITAATESDLSHLSQVFPESIDPSDTQSDIKPILDKDMNVIDVKQEYDQSADIQQGDGVPYDDPGDDSYYSHDQSYESGNEYYGGGHRNSNQRTDQMYHEGGGASGSAGDAQVASRMTAPSTGKLVCEICNSRFKNKRDLDGHINVRHLGLKPHVCPRCHKGFDVEDDDYYGDSTWTPTTNAKRLPTGAMRLRCPVKGCDVVTCRMKRHWEEKHVEIVKCLHCAVCGHIAKRRSNLITHALTKHHLSQPEDAVGQVGFITNKQYIDPHPYTLEGVLMKSQ